MSSRTIAVPDIGDFENVPVIELLVAEGDEVAAEQPLLTLESDKASIDIPAPAAGRVEKLLVGVGDTVSEGTPILELAEAESGAPRDGAASTGPERDTGTSERPAGPAVPAGGRADRDQAAAGAPGPGEADDTAQVLVLGAGPGGYTAAFRAADLGLETVLVERYPDLGGVCLNVGCIPSKALLHTAEMITGAAAMAEHGVRFGAPEIDLDRLRGWKDGVVGQLTGGLAGMAKKRGVRVVQGEARFTGPHAVVVATEGGETRLAFEQAIIAVGSQAIKLSGMPWDDPRMLDSTDALELAEIPERLLVVGGGIIGMEMASVYHGLGSRVTVVEMLDQVMPGADRDLAKAFHRFVGKRYENIFLASKVTGIEAGERGLAVRFEGEKPPERDTFDRVLVAVGRTPNGHRIDASAAGVTVDERGFIPVDGQQRTNVDHIFAIGDVVGQPMLAHKATHEGKVAAEVCAGHKVAFDARVIPSVAYTDPEVAWVGVTEAEAKTRGIDFEVGRFPWQASGRALGLGRGEGFTKLLFEAGSGRIIGAGIMGPHAGDLIAECALAIELGAEAADIGLTIHPHPTLSETVALAAEAFEGTITDLYLPRAKGGR